MSEPTLNPQIKEIEVGIRNLRNIKIYPLSVRDQLKAKEIIKSALDTLFSVSQERTVDDMVFISFIVDTVTKHIEDIVPLVTDCKITEEDDLLSDITNKQFTQLVEIVYEENFSFLASKVAAKFQAIKEKMAMLSPTNPPLQKSASAMDTDLLNSLEKGLEKVDIQSDS